MKLSLSFCVFDESKAYYLVSAVLLLLQLCPIWATPYPAMHDYPNHLARVHILHEYGENKSYQALYERDTRPIPNLAIDLIVSTFMSIASVETSSKMFLSLMVIVFNLGIHLFGFAVNRGPYWSVLACTFFTYNFAFSYGFVNYLFGVGVFFGTLAIWLHFRPHWTLARIVLTSLLTLVCYVSHLSAFVFFSLSIVCLTGIQLIKDRLLRIEHVLGLTVLVPPMLLYFLYSHGIDGTAPMIWWRPLLVKKVTGLVYPFLTYDLFIDLGLGLGFVVFVLFLLRGKGRATINWESILLSGMFVALYLCAPMSGAQSSYVDRRFLLPATLFLLLGLKINVLNKTGRHILIGLLCLTILRLGEVVYYWNRIGGEVQAQVHMLDKLPSGVRLYPMVLHESSARNWLWDMHFFFTAHYATIYRNAFVPTIYAWKGAHPLNLRTDNNDYFQVEQGTPFANVNWEVIFSNYDYLWGYKLPEEFSRFLATKGELIAQSDEAMLVRIGK